MRSCAREPVTEATEHEIGRSLGWVSLGIGLAELALPRQIERLMGLPDGENTGVLRVLGVRELMHGVDLLSHRDPTPGVWSRIAGDALDGVVLGAAAARTRRPGGFAAVLALVLPVVLADLVLAPRLSRRRQAARRRWAI